MSQQAHDKGRGPHPVQPGPPSAPYVLALKIAIVTMGVMIVVGLALVVGRIIYLASGTKGQASVADGAGKAAVEAQLALPPGAVVEHTALSGRRLVVHYRSASGGGFVVVDVQSGKTLSRIKIVPRSER